MHSTIFEWAYEPIDIEDRVVGDTFWEEGFVGSVADSVDGEMSEDWRRYEIMCLQNYLASTFPDHVICEGETVTFKTGFADEYGRRKKAACQT